MHAPQLVAVLVASGTWIGFVSTKKFYFRYADERAPAKTALLLSGFLCTAAQIITMCVARAPGEVWLWSGLAGYAGANGLFWWALAAHGKAHPAFAFIRVPPASLTTAGPYHLVRHPIYSAYLLAWAAGSVIIAQPWLLGTVACMGFIYACAAFQEEKSFMGSALAAAYQGYRQRTGMFFPKIAGLVSGLVSRS
jgi:protein-S-isoprenylcysteine O-methyltransferase Ste14